MKRLHTCVLCATLLVAGCEPSRTESKADPQDTEKVALGSKIYAQHCAACHGANLEGQPNWRQQQPNGRLPAPPHDESGHTWHHSDEVLFGITKQGVVPRYAPPGYQSDMAGFGDRLSDDEIWAVLAYIKTYWKDPRLLAVREEMLQNARKR